MYTCSLCRKEIEVDKFVSRKSTCPRCSGDLHICLNCKFYSETSHNKCLEPRAEFQRTRDKANFCDYFVFMEGPSASTPDRDAALQRFNDLFRK